MDLFDQKKENKSLTTIIFEKIREDILSDVYDNGDKIVEAKLAEKLGVSRTPVREALKQLELDGLVENIPNRGVVVKGVSKKDISDIFTIRKAIEGIAAEWCINRISKKTLQELKDIYDLMEFYTFKGDVEKISELNTKFHEVIYCSTNSRYLEQILRDFQIFIKSTRNKSLKVKGRLKEALKEHKAILAAIEDKNVEKTKVAMEYHVNKSKENVQKLL